MKFFTKDEMAKSERLRLKQERKGFLRKLTVEEHENLKNQLILRSHHQISASLVPQKNRVSIELPKEISLANNYEPTIKFINQLRNTVLTKRLPVFLHFDNVASVSPAAALLMTAEIYRCRNLRPGRAGLVPVNGNWPSDKKARKVLSDMGFYKLMQLPNNLSVLNAKEMDNTIHLGFATFNHVDAEQIAFFHHNLLEKIDFNLTNMESKRLQGAIIEAIGNASEHAYKIKTEHQFLSNRSWISGYVDVPNKELMFMVLDQGVGIPKTLDPTLIERALSIGKFRGSTPTDSELIERAAEFRRTSTGNSGRGKGVETMKRFIRTIDDGELKIFSNRGLYRYSSAGAETRDDHDGSIGGTLVQWRLHQQ
ncbi:MAG: hypothetical protein COA65_00685 [Rhodospirillaceae bacterium]|nr:MAG: hypothetical protein COA65_00685 [Rhodospirillaceae bacterium]